MNTTGRRAAVAALVVAWILIARHPVDAAVCGDATGDGTITVTDGVQILRTAAELSNTCLTRPCDVDANGRVTVTDGVNVLRAAAGLSATLRCDDTIPSPSPTPSVTQPSPTATPTLVDVLFRISACAQAKPVSPGFGGLTKYPSIKGAFVASDGVACRTSSGGTLAVNAARDGELPLVLFNANGAPLAFPIDVTCTFQVSAGETLTKEDLDLSIPKLATLDEQGVPVSGDPGVLCLEVAVDTGGGQP